LISGNNVALTHLARITLARLTYSANITHLAIMTHLAVLLVAF
jgi:hypothetical protein